MTLKAVTLILGNLTPRRNEWVKGISTLSIFFLLYVLYFYDKY